MAPFAVPGPPDDVPGPDAWPVYANKYTKCRDKGNAIAQLWNDIVPQLKSSAAVHCHTAFKKIGEKHFKRGDVVQARDWPAEFRYHLRFVCVISEADDGGRRYTIVWNPNTMEYSALGFIDRLDNYPFVKVGSSGQPVEETDDALGNWLHSACPNGFSGIKSKLERLRDRYNVTPMKGSG
jgi:hypothetical protein